VQGSNSIQLFAVNSHRSSLWKALWATLLFGSVPACIKMMAMDSYALGVWRLSLAAVGMTAMLMWQGRSLQMIAAEVRRDWKVLTAVGVCFGLHWLTYFQSIKLANASIGALAFSTCGVQLPMLGWLFGFGRPSVSAMIGVVLAMVGSAMCLPNDGGAGEGMALGLAIGIVSATLYAALPMLHKRHARLDHELRTWAQFVFALPVFLVTAPAADWTLTAHDFWLVLHLGLVVNLIGHYLWVQVSTNLPLPVTSALGYLQLPVSLAFNYVLLGELLTLNMLAGAALIIWGNVLALGTTREPPIESEPPAEMPDGGEMGYPKSASHPERSEGSSVAPDSSLRSE
jgi:drug/metabolite transporter (DMT)-like permease